MPATGGTVSWRCCWRFRWVWYHTAYNGVVEFGLAVIMARQAVLVASAVTVVGVSGSRVDERDGVAGWR